MTLLVMDKMGNNDNNTSPNTRTWKLKYRNNNTVIPVLIGALGMIKKNTEGHMK